MPVTVDIQRMGIYQKRKDKTADIGVPPCLLNEERRFGVLEENDQMDLKKGCENYRDEGYGDLYISLFDCVLKTSKPGIPLKKVLGSEFVSTRRNLISFAKSAYSKSFFFIRAIRRKGIIFLYDKRSQYEGPDATPGYGYKLEQYMTLDENGAPYDENAPVYNSECSRAVLRTTFSSGNEEIKVLYAAEIDAQDKDGNLLEIKSNGNDISQWIQKKGLDVYLQSYLGDISYVVRGETTKDQIVFKVSKVSTNELLRMGEEFWNPEICLERLFEVLQEIKKRLDRDDKAVKIIMKDGTITYSAEEIEECDFVDPLFLNHFD